MQLSIGLGFILWLDCPDRSRRSPSPAVQNIWDVHIQEVGFVPREVREELFTVCNSPDVDASWLLWNREAEASLARALILAFSSTRLLHLCFGINFRSRFVSVCNVLKGIKLHGFSEARVFALWHLWRAVVRMGPTGPVTSFEPWTHWIPPDLHGFHKWAMDTLALLNEFVLKVVHHRQTARLQAWSNWIREDLTSHPYQWLRPSGSLSGLQAPRFTQWVWDFGPATSY